MRKYFLPVVRYVARALPQPSSMQVNMKKHRAFATLMAVSSLILLSTGLIAIRSAASSDSARQDAVVHREHAAGNTATTTMITTDISAAPDTDKKKSHIQTSVTANGQRLELPDKGSYSKTLSNENGTTQITVSHDSATTSQSMDNASASTYMSVQSNTFSNDVTIHSP